MEYRGVVVREMLDNWAGDALEAANVRSQLSKVTFPVVHSKHYLPQTKGSMVWQVRPPGEWVGFVKVESLLLSTSAQIPLDVDYESVWRMLGDPIEYNQLLCRLSPEEGLIAFAVKRGPAPFEPLTPGFQAVSKSPLIVSSEVEKERQLRELSQSGFDWPAGLQQPSIIHIQSPLPLFQTEHYVQYKMEYPEGIWLTCRVRDEKAGIDRLDIFEV